MSQIRTNLIMMYQSKLYRKKCEVRKEMIEKENENI